MRKILLILLPAIFFMACDKVDRPVQNPNALSKCPFNDTIVVTNIGSNGFRKVLLEDYTGHTCGNCPRAARVAEAIVHTYGNKVVVIANHVSSQFAQPVSETHYKEDFRNETGNDWDVFFGMSSAGLPKGNVNRTKPYPRGDGAWTGLVETALNQPQSAKLDVTSYYDRTQKLLNVDVKTTFLQAVAGNIKMVIVLTQDSIISEQKDYAPPAGVVTEDDGETRPDYLFENLLIGSVNGTWGQLVKESPAKGDTLTIKNSCYVLGKCFFKNTVCVNDKNVNVVVFVYNDETKEVLQVEKLRIMGDASQ